MSHQVLRPMVGGVAVAALAILALAPGSALAHEHRTIDDGKYTLIVGWDTEPPIQGQPNAATVQVNLADTDPTQPIEGAEQTLRLQIRQGRTTLQLPLHALMGKPGSYAADVVPDHDGDAQLTLSGSVNGDSVDEVFDTADGKFDAVKPAGMANSGGDMDGAGTLDATDH
jgi:D-alanyl-D-alanine carboxypeptidase